MLTIDLCAIQKNWLQLKTSSSATIAGVIKANAYGLGAKEVGNALYEVGCREFFLASFDEAKAAREYLPADSLIYVLGGLRDIDLSELCRLNLIPVLYSVGDLNRWFVFRQAHPDVGGAVIKMNTGMTRFGLDDHELAALCADLDKLRIVNPLMLMSHLACADEAHHPLNQQQHTRFQTAVIKMKSVCPGLRASFANSSGFFLGDAWHFDLVRPGAALYGINPTPADKNPMHPVLSLSLPIVQVRRLIAEATIGYGATATLREGARVAVVAGGYADGVHRTLGLQPQGRLLGQVVKAVGRISMDSMMFDISHIDATDDELMEASIDVIGEDISLDTLMQQQGTLGYEVLTSLGSRYPRRYIRGQL